MRSYIILILLCVGSWRTGVAQNPGWQSIADPAQKLAAFRAFIGDCFKQKKYDAAIVAIPAGLQLARAQGADSTAAFCFAYLGSAYRYKSKFDSALFYLDSGMQIAGHHRFPAMEAIVEIERFGIYNLNGKYDSAASAMGRIDALVPLIDSNGRDRGRIELYRGHFAKRHAKYAPALEHYYHAERIFTRLKDSVNIGIIYAAIANLYNYINQPDQALTYFRLSERINILNDRPGDLAIGYVNTADLFLTIHQPDSAEVYAKKTLVIAETLNSNLYRAFGYLNLGLSYSMRDRFALGETNLQKSLRLSEENDISNARGESIQGLGELYMKSGQPGKAKPYLEKYLGLMMDQGKTDYNEMIELYLDLARNEHALHNDAKAYEYQKLYAVYKDSAYTESLSRNSAEMESKYQSEKKEKEIVLLKKDGEVRNLELEKQRAIKLGSFALAGLLLIIGFLSVNRYRVIQKAKRLVEIEKLRNHIARDLHDDIGSALSSININSRFALTHGGGDPMIRGQLQNIQANSGRMMESMSDIVWAINPAQDGLENLALKMKEFLAEILEPLNIQYQFNDGAELRNLRLNVEQRRDVYLIFKEAVNNAAKYSHCRNLKVAVTGNRREVIVQIIDDGQGFDRTSAAPGNGLRNMEQRAASIGARLSIDSTPGRGTTVSLYTKTA